MSPRRIALTRALQREVEVWHGPNHMYLGSSTNQQTMHHRGCLDMERDVLVVRRADRCEIGGS